MENTRIYAYKGVLMVDLDADKANGLINDPSDGNQLGCVIKSDCIDITKDAKELIRGANRTGGSFSGLMLTEHTAKASEKFGKSSFGIMGFGKVAIDRADIKVGRDCELSVLDDMNEVEIEVPKEFKEFVDNK